MNEARSLKRVGICGSYGGFSLGDEAILQVFVSGLRKSMPVEIIVFSRDAQDTRRRHLVEHVVRLNELSRRETLKIIANLDLFILGGGGILYDADADMYLREVLLAHEAKTPVMICAISAGPLVDAARRSHVRDTLNKSAVITVRDRHARQLLEEVGVEPEIVLTADPALILEADAPTLEEILRAEAVDPAACLIGCSVREPGPAAPDLDVEHYHRLLANAADFLIDRLDAEVVFFQWNVELFDVQHSHAVVGWMSHAQCATVLKRDYTAGQILSLLGHFHFAVGMRLHFLIFSALAHVPFVGLPYATKVTGFLEELELQAPVLERVSAGQLIAHIDRAWDLRDELRNRVDEALPALRARAQVNTDVAVHLLLGSIGTSGVVVTTKPRRRFADDQSIPFSRGLAHQACRGRLNRVWPLGTVSRRTAEHICDAARHDKGNAAEQAPL
jgi:polysaccharide pyruvyl transferase CsaB